MAKRIIEGPADTGQPAEEGAKVPGDDAVRRNTTGRFPGDANAEEGMEKEERAEQERAQVKNRVRKDRTPTAPSEGRH